MSQNVIEHILASMNLDVVDIVRQAFFLWRVIQEESFEWQPFLKLENIQYLFYIIYYGTSKNPIKQGLKCFHLCLSHVVLFVLKFLQKTQLCTTRNNSVVCLINIQYASVYTIIRMLSYNKLTHLRRQFVAAISYQVQPPYNGHLGTEACCPLFRGIHCLEV